jgi:hypothetical protein
MSETSSHLGKPSPPPANGRDRRGETGPHGSCNFAEHVRSAKYRRHHTRHDLRFLPEQRVRYAWLCRAGTSRVLAI